LPSTWRALGATVLGLLFVALILPSRGTPTSGEDGGYGAVAGGFYHTLVVTPSGQAWAWGDNLYGSLGNGTTTDRYVPGQVTSLTGIKAVAASYGLSLALQSNGDLWTFGLNNNGQIGDGTTTNRLTPFKAMTGVASMAAGELHVLAVKTDGTVWAFGDNAYGQLGQGAPSAIDQKTPIQVPGLTGMSKVAAGQYFSATVRTSWRSA
jgi:alpha-tubulin suppressor-like RCC1 family protein